jgi:hypothetical protein
MSQDYQKTPKYYNWLNLYIDKPNDSLYEYISQNIDPEDIFIFIDLIYPDFQIYEGLIFFKERFSENAYKTWMKELNGNFNEVQILLNKLCVYDIFGHHSTHVDDFVYEKIGLFLRDNWEQKSKQQFPELKIIVEYSNTDNDYGPTLYLYQENKIVD